MYIQEHYIHVIGHNNTILISKTFPLSFSLSSPPYIPLGKKMDYTNMSLTQAKRLEMESQVRALELEKELEMERTRLAELRKVHYHLAGASEGWEEVSREDISHCEFSLSLSELWSCY